MSDHYSMSRHDVMRERIDHLGKLASVMAERILWESDDMTLDALSAANERLTDIQRERNALLVQLDWELRRTPDELGRLPVVVPREPSWQD